MTNLFIVSLAVADLCVAGVVMPFYAYTMVGISFILGRKTLIVMYRVTFLTGPAQQKF